MRSCRRNRGCRRRCGRSPDRATRYDGPSPRRAGRPCAGSETRAEREGPHGTAELEALQVNPPSGQLPPQAYLPPPQRRADLGLQTGEPAPLVPRALEPGQQGADPPGQRLARAEVDRPLPGALAIGQPEVGPQPPPAVRPPCRHHRPLRGKHRRPGRQLRPHPLQPVRRPLAEEILVLHGHVLRRASISPRSTAAPFWSTRSRFSALGGPGDRSLGAFG